MAAAALVSKPSFSQRLVDLLDQVECRRAETPEDKEAVYRLRYQAYVREGNIGPNASGVLHDHFDDAANSWSFGLYTRGRLASSIRISVASDEHGASPATRFFPDILEPEVDAGRVIVDPNRLVTDFAAARDMPELAYLTVRLGYVAAWHFSADIVTATVRAEHQAFYKRVFGLKPDCLPRRIPPIEKPFCLMSFRDESMAAIMNRYPCFRSTDAERAALFERPQTAPGPIPFLSTPREPVATRPA